MRTENTDNLPGRYRSHVRARLCSRSLALPSRFSILTSQFRGGARRGAAFTLAELMVVVAIIGLLIGIVIPGISSMWSQRLESQAETIVAGALRSVQVQARSHGERGLFFYLEDGTQKMVTIQPAHANPGVATVGTLPQVLADCFEVIPATVNRIPSPYRVTPRIAVLDPTIPSNNLSLVEGWEDAELVSEDYQADNGDGNQRHRNFFTLVFGPDGRLNVRRDVLVYDPTGLTDLAVADEATYYDRDGASQDFSLVGSDIVQSMVTDGTHAINFPSVDGVLVYDESLWQELPDDGASRRDWCEGNAKPYYVARLSGSVIRGPVGE